MNMIWAHNSALSEMCVAQCGCKINLLRCAGENAVNNFCDSTAQPPQLVASDLTLYETDIKNRLVMKFKSNDDAT